MLTKNPFEGKKEINVVFLGGSITEGHCASEKSKCYAGLCAEWFKNKFSSQKVNYINVGVGGTGSGFGAVRMDRDVIANNPDMLFVEFAVNDGNSDSRATMESIVRKALGMKNVPYIVFLYTANKTYTVDVSYHEEVAKYYGIPTINLQDALKEKISGANPVEKGLFLDGVHPLDGGFAIYAETITEKLSDDSFYKKPADKEPLMNETVLINAEFVPSPGYTYSDGWTVRTGHRGYECLYTDKAGETLSFEFDGNFLAIEAGLHRECGLLDVCVDGELIKTMRYYYDMVSFQTNYQLVTQDIPIGHHKVEITLKAATDEHPGSVMQIYHIITGTAI